MSPAARVAVVGGGLAGLAAALELADGGHEVVIHEARPTLGGAVQTLPEREGDPPPPPDNGQHIALGCFTEYRRFVERIGKGGALRREPLSLPVIDERARTSFVRPGLRLLGYSHLPLSSRLRIARVTLRLRGLSPEEHSDETFGDLLRGLGQKQGEIDRFWDVFIRPGLNLPTDEAGADYGIFTVQTALLGWRCRRPRLHVCWTRSRRRSRTRRSSASTCSSTGRFSGTGWPPCSTHRPTGCSTAARSRATPPRKGAST